MNTFLKETISKVQDSVPPLPWLLTRPDKIESEKRRFFLTTGVGHRDEVGFRSEIFVGLAWLWPWKDDRDVDGGTCSRKLLLPAGVGMWLVGATVLGRFLPWLTVSRESVESEYACLEVNIIVD